MSDALGRALPDRPQRHGSLLPWVRGQRAQRRIARAFIRTTMSPPASGWGAFGQSSVLAPARVSRPDLVEIGDDVVVLEDVWMSVEHVFDDIRPRLVLGDRVRVGRGCQFSVVGEVIIEEDVLIGDFVQIGDTYHPYEAPVRAGANARPRPTRIGAGALLGGHVVVLAGVTIGAGALVDHCSVVTADVPRGASVHGNPARQVVT